MDVRGTIASLVVLLFLIIFIAILVLISTCLIILIKILRMRTYKGELKITLYALLAVGISLLLSSLLCSAIFSL